MNPLVNQIAERTGIGQDKAQQAVDITLNFLKSKLPGSVSGHLDSIVQGGSAEGASGVTEKVKDGLEGVFRKKTA